MMKINFKSFFIPKLLLLRGLKSGWPDEARLITQGDTFRKVLSQHEFSGLCLNAGCGEGLYSEFLESFQQVSEIINLDLNYPPIPEERGDARHRAKAGSLTCLPFKDASFDSCLCSEVIEHIEDDAVAISELARVIKLEGLLLLSVPTPPAPHDPAHVREGYTLEELSKLLITNGFTIVNHAYCFHVLMRIFFVFWQWQFYVIGRGKRSYFPQFLVSIFGYMDKYIRLGKPWDLVILTQKVT